MFAKEHEMVNTVARWIRADGMIAKSEFVTPWGICDLVGLRFSVKKVAMRLGRHQKHSVSSLTRASVLLQIPDVETGHFVTFSSLIRKFAHKIPEETVRSEASRLIEDGFVVRSSNRLQKLNGWMPLQERIVAVELKLSRIEEAMRQASNNLGFADESYAAFPLDVALRIAAKPTRWSTFLDRGVGLLAVSALRCETLISARKNESFLNSALQLYSVEKFWRTRIRDSSSSAVLRSIPAFVPVLPHRSDPAETCPRRRPTTSLGTGPSIGQFSVPKR
jgi:hypothetical protein